MSRPGRNTTRVKSGNFGLRVNSDNDLVCFIFILIFGIKKNKQTVQILMRIMHKEPSH